MIQTERQTLCKRPTNKDTDTDKNSETDGNQDGGRKGASPGLSFPQIKGVSQKNSIITSVFSYSHRPALIASNVPSCALLQFDDIRFFSVILDFLFLHADTYLEFTVPMHRPFCLFSFSFRLQS
mmetsp:Transcript_664/g.1477  ORF Transcript_664/g.1477 Transcript_664/m.1477 type:complete len:124 (+) Transcript_664:69-440(+)